MPDDTPNEVINKITQITLRSIQETRMLIDEEKLITIANVVKRAEIIDFFGVGTSSTVAMDAATKFMRIGKNVCYYNSESAQLIVAKNADKKHVGIIVSYTGETNSMVEVASCLKNNDAAIVTITGNNQNRLIEYTENNLFISSKETTYRSGAVASRTSTLYLIDLLYNLCIMLDYSKSLKNVLKTRVASPNELNDFQNVKNDSIVENNH